MTSEYEISGWHYSTRQPLRIRCAGGRIVGVSPASPAPPLTTWIVPGLFDLQVNGFAGVDFQQDDLTVEQLLVAARSLRIAGCSRFLVTLITDEWPRMLRRLEMIRTLRNASPELRGAIAGWHVEGPFLSDEAGFCGAHDPAFMRDPRLEDIEQLRAAAGSDPLLLTLAPEREGSQAAIQKAVSMGMRVSLGHTNAPAHAIREAVLAGASGFTHLANGCPRDLDRHDNILWRVLETPGLMVSLIPDGIHVSPPLFRLMHSVLAGESICYVSDAMAAAAASPGRYTLGKLEVEAGADGVVRQPGSKLFAGSALRPVEGVFRAARMLGCDWRQAWERFSSVPARFMGISHSMLSGEQGSFCLVEVSEAGELMSCQMHPRTQ
jgi:N-acetylglucosamine-6-phosphate deacetylase